MKRRIETQIVWDFTRHDLSKGLITNLFPRQNLKEIAAIYLKNISVSSFKGGTEGRIYVLFNHELGEHGDPQQALKVAILSVYSKLHREHVVTGHMGSGPFGFDVGFELSRKEHSFCDKALGIVARILEELGIQHKEVFCPRISQETFVWIPQSKLARPNKNFWGWIEYGQWLGEQHGFKKQ